MTIKALTVWQPWASLLAWGRKKYETRSWAPSQNVCAPGQLIAIHAGARDPLAWDWYGQDWCVRDLVFQMLAYENVELADLPLGAIIGIGRVAHFRQTSIVSNTPVMREDAMEYEVTMGEQMLGDWSPGRWAWRIEPVLRLRGRIVIPGHQRLWNWEIPVQIVRQLNDVGCPLPPCCL